MNIGRSIKIGMAYKGLTTTALAKLIEMSQPHVSALSNNRHHANIDTIEKMATAMDYKVSEFIALGEEEKAA